MAVQQRRGELGWTAGRLAAEAEVSPSTVSKIETNGGATTRVLAKISTTLGWPRDALERVSDGEDPPAPVAQPDRLGELERDVALLRGELDSQQRLLDTLLSRLEVRLPE